METIQTALVGFGPGGRVYNAPIIAAIDGMAIKMILTSSPDNIAAAKKDFPDAVVVQDYEAILRNKDINLVVISIPNHLHREFAEKALRADKHVLVEKPFTPTVKEAEHLIRVAKEQGKIISVNHNRRWDSDIRSISRILNEGRLGRIVEYEAHFDRFRPYLKDSWKEKRENPGSGILYDLGSHLIDQALWLFGKPAEVFAHLRAQREDSEVVDNFELLLLYPTLKVTLKAGMLVHELGPRYQIFGEKGSFVKWGMDVQEEDLKNGLKPDENEPWGQEPEAIWGRLNLEGSSERVPSEQGDYRLAYQNIRDSIRRKASLLVTPQQAMEVVRVIELAYQSHAEKRILPYSL